MDWMATHRLIYAEKPNQPETIEVMAWDLGFDHPDPGRYALYTREEREANAIAAWTMDVEGGVWFKGEALPANATAVVEGIWS
jgi:hypothetical protein